VLGDRVERDSLASRASRPVFAVSAAGRVSPAELPTTEGRQPDRDHVRSTVATESAICGQIFGDLRSRAAPICPALGGFRGKLDEWRRRVRKLQRIPYSPRDSVTPSGRVVADLISRVASPVAVTRDPPEDATRQVASGSTS